MLYHLIGLVETSSHFYDVLTQLFIQLQEMVYSSQMCCSDASLCSALYPLLGLALLRRPRRLSQSSSVPSFMFLDSFLSAHYLTPQYQVTVGQALCCVLHEMHKHV